jgi:tetratricopeptide (TPR) repeat protein
MRGDHEKAIADLDCAIRVEPDDTFALNSRVQVFQMLKRFEDAIRDLTRALEIDPDNTFTLRCRGNMLRMLGRFNEAIIDLDRAVTKEPAVDGVLAFPVVAKFSRVPAKRKGKGEKEDHVLCTDHFLSPGR